MCALLLRSRVTVTVGVLGAVAVMITTVIAWSQVGLRLRNCTRHIVWQEIGVPTVRSLRSGDSTQARDRHGGSQKAQVQIQVGVYL